MYVFQEYPRWMYGPNGATCIVQDREGEDALGDGWSHFPQQAAAVLETSPPPPVEPAVALQDETQEWRDRAAALNITLDRRWGLETIKAKVREAEALAKA